MSDQLELGCRRAWTKLIEDRCNELAGIDFPACRSELTLVGPSDIKEIRDHP